MIFTDFLRYFFPISMLILMSLSSLFSHSSLLLFFVSCFQSCSAFFSSFEKILFICCPYIAFLAPLYCFWPTCCRHCYPHYTAKHSFPKFLFHLSDCPIWQKILPPIFSHHIYTIIVQQVLFLASLSKTHCHYHNAMQKMRKILTTDYKNCRILLLHIFWTYVVHVQHNILSNHPLCTHVRKR